MGRRSIPVVHVLGVKNNNILYFKIFESKRYQTYDSLHHCSKCPSPSTALVDFAPVQLDEYGRHRNADHLPASAAADPSETDPLDCAEAAVMLWCSSTPWTQIVVVRGNGTGNCLVARCK